MGYLHHIDTTKKLAVVRLGGVITGQDLTEACSALFLDRSWKPYYNHVWDTRSVSTFKFDCDDVNALKMLIASFKKPGEWPEGKSAIVISGRISDFLVEAGDLLVELFKKPIMFFSEIEEAKDWVEASTVDR